MCHFLSANTFSKTKGIILLISELILIYQHVFCIFTVFLKTCVHIFNRNYQVSPKYIYSSFVFVDDPSRDPDIEAPVDQRAEFCCVFESKLNQHRLFYKKEMHGVSVEGSSLRKDFTSADLFEEQVLVKLNKSQFVELKTSKLNNKNNYMYR